MPKLIMLPTFEEFRRSHRGALREQRERLRNESVAENVRREISARGIVWVPWDNDGYAFAT